MAKPAKAVAVVKEKEVAIMQGNSPADMIRMAVAGKADLNSLEKLLELQERFEANQARKAYHQAMAEFKANAPKIGKDKKVGYSTSKGNVGYSHASLSNVTDKISAELSKHGLSASWTTKQNGQIMVTCKITHILGHSEETTISAPADASGSKNAIQAIGSTITYLERYTLLALAGLATHDMDDDGKAAGKPEVSMPEAVKPAPNATKPAPAATLTPKGKDIPETEAMNQRAASMAETFEACENLIELEEQAAGLRNEINTTMSQSYKKWIKGVYESCKKAIEDKAKENTGE